MDAAIKFLIKKKKKKKNSQSFWAKQIQFESLKHLLVRGDHYVWTQKWRHMRRRLSFETQK